MKFYPMLGLAATLLAAPFGLTAGTSDPTTTTVVVDGQRNSDGSIILLGFENAAAFEAMNASEAVVVAIVPATADQTSVTFHNLGSDKIAFAALHDEDSNGEISMADEVPTEGYAMNAMGPSGLPPRFEDAAMETGGQFRLKLKYWN